MWVLLNRGWLTLAFLLAGALAVAADDERLWMPEGYRLLSLEERQGLSQDELKGIHAKNMAALEAALAPMSSSYRSALAQHLEEFRRTHTLSDVEKQYVTIVSMRLLAGAVQEHAQREIDAEKERFQKLLKDQEQTTRGFATDEKSVEAEASQVEAEMDRKGDSRKLYLRVLGPLRARPWNDYARVMFRRLVRYDSHPNSRSGTRYDAALVFLKARQAEDPEQGSWYSLEAILRLSLRGEVAQAKKLFSTAIAKDARDVESHIYPLLIAEIEGDEAERARLHERARKIWVKEEELDFELFRQIPFLPEELQVRARSTFERRYKGAHPADWASRIEVAWGSIRDGRAREVEEETGGLLSLPLTVLPEPHRSEFFMLNLRAKADLGKCGEVAAEIPRLESRARAAYPRETDPGAAPAARTAAEVRALKGAMKERRRELESFKTAMAEGAESAPAGEGGESAKEQEELMKGFLARLEDELRTVETLPFEKDDASVAAEWSRRELVRWEKSHGILPNQDYDIASKAERLSILARAALARCLLARHQPAEAARVVKPCLGGGRNFHSDCLFPLVDAGTALAGEGHVSDAIAIYELAAPTFVSTTKLYEAIEKAAPGKMKPYQPTPMQPVTLPTPVPH